MKYSKFEYARSIWLLTGLVIFPSTAFLGGIEPLSFMQWFEFWLMPKFSDFHNENPNTLILMNQKFWFILFVPFILTMVWCVVYLFLIKVCGESIYLGERFGVNLLIYLGFLFIPVFIAFFFTHETVTLTRRAYKLKDIDYSTIMSLVDYVAWQSKMYLFVNGLSCAAFCLATFTSLLRPMDLSHTRNSKKVR